MTAPAASRQSVAVSRMLYSTGLGVRRDLGAARAWIGRAAEAIACALRRSRGDSLRGWRAGLRRRRGGAAGGRRSIGGVGLGLDLHDDLVLALAVDVEAAVVALDELEDRALARAAVELVEV